MKKCIKADTIETLGEIILINRQSIEKEDANKGKDLLRKENLNSIL